MCKQKTMRDLPEIAAEITYYISNFNLLETSINMLVAQMIGDGVGATHAFLSRLNGFGQRLDIIIDVCSTMPDNPKAAVLIANKDRFSELSQFRNLLAHSVYSIDDGKLEALSYLVSRRAPIATPITETLLKEKQTLMREVHDCITAATDVNVAYTRPQKAKPKP